MADLDHYQLLGVSYKATQAEIKAAYKSLCQKLHPDKDDSESASELFMKVRRAYDVLSDPTRKKLYDAGVRQGLNSDEFKKLLKSLIGQVIAESLSEAEAYNGHWINLAKKVMREEKRKAESKQLELKRKDRFLARHIAAIKDGRDSLLAQALYEQQAIIASGLESLKCLLAVIEYLASDTENIIYEFESEDTTEEFGETAIQKLLGGRRPGDIIWKA